MIKTAERVQDGGAAVLVRPMCSPFESDVARGLKLLIFVKPECAKAISESIIEPLRWA